MTNKINFITGETYSLSELFSGERKIIIPDLQRDYCWGNEEHTSEKKELVSDFVNDIITQYNESKENTQIKSNLNLGLIYGYEVPANHIQLCDGQQRITTLYLLLGMLNKYSTNNQFRQYLISDFEYTQNDKEPYLQYSVRESLLYFLSDLVCRFFITNKESNIDKVERIAKPENSWYFNDYNFDPSIQSMLKALSKIEIILEDKDSDWISEFGDFLVNKLTFMYYDMGNRKNGEETFVIINTTGEPLSATQNLKPRIINAKINENYNKFHETTLASKWEEIETWFWSKRGNGHDTADVGFKEFLRWVTILYYAKEGNKEEINSILEKGIYSFPIEEISFETIKKYWKSVKFIFDEWNKSREKNTSEKELYSDMDFLSPKDNTISQIDCFKLLPIIEYCYKHSVKETDNRNLLRIYHFFDNIASHVTVSETIIDAIKITRDNEDIVGLLKKYEADNKYVSSTILTKEEKLKLSILSGNENRIKIEESFWAAQKDKIWAGEILPLIQWSIEDKVFDFNLFIQYRNIFETVFYGECDSNIDITRRALLTRGLKDYPRKFKGYTNYSFGWEWNDWKVLINDNIIQFKKFFDDLINSNSLKECQEKMIGDFDGQGFKYLAFVKNTKLLKYCEEKNIQLDDKQGVLLIKGVRATTYMSLKNMLLIKYLAEDETIKNSGWKVWAYDGESVSRVVVENEDKDLVFDIWYWREKKENEKETWKIDFFKRNNEEVEKSLKSYVNDKWNFNSNDNRYHTTIDFDEDFSNVSNFLKEMIKKIGN